MVMRTWVQNIGTFLRGGRPFPPAADEMSNSQLLTWDDFTFFDVFKIPLQIMLRWIRIIGRLRRTPPSIRGFLGGGG